MALKINVGLSRKVGEPNYGSRGASLNMEMELDSSLVSEPGKLHENIGKLFGLIRASLASELNGKPQPAAIAYENPQGRDAQPRPATPSQIKAIYAIARSRRLDAGRLVRERFQVQGGLEALTVKEASQLIDELKSSRS